MSKTVSDEHMAMLRVIREQHPEICGCIGARSRQARRGRHQSLQTMANFSLVKLNNVGGNIVPEAACERVTLELD